MRPGFAAFAAVTWVLSACEDRRDVYLGSLASGVGGKAAAGQGGSGVCDGSCSTLACARPTDNSSARLLFATATSEPPGTDAAREPVIVYPSHETKLPSNVPRIYCEWWPGAENTLFELELRGLTTRVVYTNEPRWLPTDAEWLSLAQENQGGSLVVRGRALNGASPEHAFESEPLTLYFGAPLLDAPIYYWSTTAQGIMRTRLAGSNPERLSTPPGGSEAASCAGCHAISRDGTKLSFDVGGQLRVANVADLTPRLVAAGGTGGEGPMAGKMVDKIGPDTAAAWSSFSPDGTRIVLALDGALTLLDANGVGKGTGMGTVALPPKAVATHPDWSPTGERLVFTLAEKGNGRAVERGQIASAPYEADHFGAVEILVPSQAPDDSNLFPSVSPDGKFVAYVNTRGKSENAAASELRLLRLSDKRVFSLERLNRRVRGRSDASGVANSMPTWAPSTSASELWLSFSSARAYASLRPQDKKSDQLWLAALDPAAAEEPDFAAFWAPFQKLDHSNHRAVWASGSATASCDCDRSNCSVACAPSETCGDGIDNDHDCVIDDCRQLEICGDGVDNDGDGSTDAADLACSKP